MFDSELLQTAAALGGGALGVRNGGGGATGRRLAAPLGAPVPGGLQPGGVHGRGHGRGAGGRGDLPDDAEGLRQGRVLAEHFLPPLPLLR